MSPLSAWAQLVRLPNVFTVLADVGAAFLVGRPRARHRSGRLVLVLLAGVALYWAGMILNDVFDVEQDRQQRPNRPIPAGQISLEQARCAGWGLLLIGNRAGGGKRLRSRRRIRQAPGCPPLWVSRWRCMIVAYDGPLKKTPLAPAAMGGCRVLSFLLGAAALLCRRRRDSRFSPGTSSPSPLGFGIYVMGITTMARHEATGGPNPNLATGLLVTIIGAAVLALRAQHCGGNLAWRIDPHRHFPILDWADCLSRDLAGLSSAERSRSEKNPGSDSRRCAHDHSAGRRFRLARCRQTVGADCVFACCSRDLVGDAIASDCSR